MLFVKSTLLIAVLSIAFAFTNLLVWITKGKDKIWITRKLRLGGILLGLTTVGMTDVSCRVTCHDAPSEPLLLYTLLLSSINLISFNSAAQNGKEITVSLSGSTAITGTIYNRQSAAFSYFIINASGSTVQSADLTALDGNFDTPTENFSFNLNAGIVSGDYTIKIYKLPAADVVAGQTYEIKSITLHVVP